MTTAPAHAAIVVDHVRQADVEPGEDPAQPAVGKWYWVKERDADEHPDEDESEDEEGEDDEEEEPPKRWLGCVTHLGSNYVALTGTKGGYTRVHFDVFFTHCTYEPNAEAIVKGEIAKCQQEVMRLMQEARAVTARLCVAPSLSLPGTTDAQSTALALSESVSAKEYEDALVLAKDTTLPEIFDRIRKENETLAQWMTAELIPLKAEAAALKPSIERIEERIFSVELYAGLSERIERILDGEPAPLTEPVHLMQRRCYMDEECLAHYEIGGMEFKNLGEFDRWLARPDNLGRVLPFPRCIVAFRVRRHKKERAWDGSYAEFFRINDLVELDQLTFLYLRNGQQLYRLSTKIEFGGQLFPEQIAEMATTRYMRQSHETKFISEARYQGMVEDKAAGKLDHWSWENDPENWELFSPASVYYDDAVETIRKEAEEHNRLVLVLQGILDRSPVFHPHPPWSLWDPASFKQAIALVYDDARALTTGDAPDFEAYRARCNASLSDDSVTVGQYEPWTHKEAKKENERRRNDWRSSSRDRYLEHFHPHSNPGPGKLAHVASFQKRAGTVTYAWTRKRSRDYDDDGDAKGDIRCTFTCEASEVFNVSAYKPGDFKQFFADPRTRADYLQWAPILLTAEEYHAGNRTASNPAPARPKQPSTYEGRQRYALRKQRAAFLGQAVRLTCDIKMKNGKTNKKGSLWRVYAGEGRLLSVTGILPTGERDNTDGGRGISNLSFYDVEIDPTIPGEPKPAKRAAPDAAPDADEEDE